MTSKERLEALYRYEKPDRVPLGAMSTGFNTVNAGMTVYEAYADAKKSFDAMQWTAEQYGWDPVPQYAGHTVLGAWDFGGDVRLPKGQYEGALMVKSHPVSDEKEIDRLQPPDPKTAGRIPQALQFAQLQADRGLPVFFFSRSPFTMAGNITETEQFMSWILRKPELCLKLIELSMNHIFNVLGVWAKTFGPEKIFVWMSSPGESNQLISPRIFEKFATPSHEEYHHRLQTLSLKLQGVTRPRDLVSYAGCVRNRLYRDTVNIFT